MTLTHTLLNNQRIEANIPEELENTLGRMPVEMQHIEREGMKSGPCSQRPHSCKCLHGKAILKWMSRLPSWRHWKKKSEGKMDGKERSRLKGKQ